MTWRVADSLIKLREQIDARWPNRSRVSDGTIGDASHQADPTSDHNPHVPDPTGRAKGVVTAFDITHDPAHGLDGNKLALDLAGSRDPRIKYLIWNRRILSSTISPWVWRPYTGSDPHTNHIHLSVVGSPQSRFDSRAEWDIGARQPRWRYELRIDVDGKQRTIAASRPFTKGKGVQRASEFLRLKKTALTSQAARGHKPRIVRVEVKP